MKKTLTLLLAACALAATATAAPQFSDIPPDMQKVLQGNALKSAQLDNQGVLRLTSEKPAISELTFASLVFHTICAQQWRHPEEFARWQLTRVQLLEVGAQQGYAFDARGDICQRMGQMGQNYRSVIQQRTVVCSSGQCPAQP